MSKTLQACQNNTGGFKSFRKFASHENMLHGNSSTLQINMRKRSPGYNASQPRLTMPEHFLQCLIFGPKSHVNRTQLLIELLIRIVNQSNLQILFRKLSFGFKKLHVFLATVVLNFQWNSCCYHALWYNENGGSMIIEMGGHKKLVYARIFTALESISIWYIADPWEEVFSFLFSLPNFV